MDSAHAACPGTSGSGSASGELELRANNQLAGEYLVFLAPQAPVGLVLAMSCRYRQFSDARLDNGCARRIRVRRHAAVAGSDAALRP